VSGILRTEFDVGLLSNVRMGAEIATGVAHLTGRRLCMPFEQPIPPAPASSIPAASRGRPATLLDLYEFPIDIVHPDEWADLETAPAEIVEWGEITDALLVCDDAFDIADPQLCDFANGRTRFLRPPSSEASIVDLRGRLLSFYSYFFFAPPPVRRRIHAVLRGLRPRLPFVAFGAHVARDLGSYDAVHIRRSDLTFGIPAYKDVTPQDVADDLTHVIDPTRRLLVCSEVEGDDPFFDPLRKRFGDIVFANDVILQDHRDGFFALPRHEDNALGLVTQQIAARAGRFVGTIGSTFTAMIQRERVQRDPTDRFLYTADFTPPGPCFRRGEFQEIADGSYSWNRLAYSMSPVALSWFREWPECA